MDNEKTIVRDAPETRMSYALFNKYARRLVYTRASMTCVHVMKYDGDNRYTFADYRFVSRACLTLTRCCQRVFMSIADT